MLTHSQIALVKSSFAIVLQRKAQVSKGVYERFFETTPEIRHMFTTEPAVQREKVFQAVASVVRALSSEAELDRLARDLAASHLRRQVPPEFFDKFAESIIASMELSVGARFNAETRTAWEVAFADLVSRIRQSMILLTAEL